MAPSFQFSQGEPAKIHSSPFPGLRCAGRLCSAELSCLSPMFLLLVHPKMRCWRRVPSSGTRLRALLLMILGRASPHCPICFPLNTNAFQVYLPITAYICLLYKYFCKAPFRSPQLHWAHCNCQLAGIYRYSDNICRSRCGTGSSHTRCWEKVECKYHIQLFLNIIFPNFGK